MFACILFVAVIWVGFSCLILLIYCLIVYCLWFRFSCMACFWLLIGLFVCSLFCLLTCLLCCMVLCFEFAVDWYSLVVCFPVGLVVGLFVWFVCCSFALLWVVCLCLRLFT